MLSGFYFTEIISYVSHLWRLDSPTRSVFLKLCYVLVPEPIITIKQVDFRRIALENDILNFYWHFEENIFFPSYCTSNTHTKKAEKWSFHMY